MISSLGAFAQSNSNQTQLYEWNVENVGVATGERIVATITSNGGSYSGAGIVGQIIDGNSNWGNAMPTMANFKLFVSFDESKYKLEQDVIASNVTLKLKRISATQITLVANCTDAHKQLRILFRYSSGLNTTVALGSSGVVIESGTTLIAQPTYLSNLTGKLNLNVANNVNTSDYTLAVGGKAIAESITVKLQSGWADYVFNKDYKLPSLKEVKAFIDKNHHLPDMPSEGELVKDGLNLGEINKVLTKKVEELTLYLIEKDNQMLEQRKAIADFKSELDDLKKQMLELKTKNNN
jgi:hypothetical protein